MDSRQEFASYLQQPAADCAKAHGGEAYGGEAHGGKAHGEKNPGVRDPGSPAAQRRPHQTIDGFLRAWVRLLERRLDGTDPLHEEAPGRPGWRGLAFQLHSVRTTPSGSAPALADDSDPVTGPYEVDSAHALRRYVAALATDFVRDQRETQAKFSRGEWAGDGGSWAHHSLCDWLDAWASWTDANSPRHAELEPVTWRSVALQLAAAQGYE